MKKLFFLFFVVVSLMWVTNKGSTVIASANTNEIGITSQIQSCIVANEAEVYYSLTILGSAKVPVAMIQTQMLTQKVNCQPAVSLCQNCRNAVLTSKSVLVNHSQLPGSNVILKKPISSSMMSASATQKMQTVARQNSSSNET